MYRIHAGAKRSVSGDEAFKEFGNFVDLHTQQVEQQEEQSREQTTKYKQTREQTKSKNKHVNRRQSKNKHVNRRQSKTKHVNRRQSKNKHVNRRQSKKKHVNRRQRKKSKTNKEAAESTLARDPVPAGACQNRQNGGMIDMLILPLIQAPLEVIIIRGVLGDTSDNLPVMLMMANFETLVYHTQLSEMKLRKFLPSMYNRPVTRWPANST
ncbi:hypothetical protein CHS0354_007513 [Potamilus streckersoni]|uniref:Uncharacterized protein n=1 Tax=Potamilus streckersoni TaxID=2493646 RepID=A0AAE0W8I9_9BIVA|nr:hypothetical protein CHS0354_007513 [Potamilus streckersoni]